MKEFANNVLENFIGCFAHLGAVSGVISAQSRIDFMKIVLKTLQAQQADADHKEC